VGMLTYLNLARISVNVWGSQLLKSADGLHL
jgi:hypothetical protein